MTAAQAPRNTEVFANYSPRERVILPNIIDKEKERKSCGFHLTRSKWDPYPWVGFVEPGSIAQIAGLRAGDCLLEVCGQDVVGLRVRDIATLIQNRAKQAVDLEVWRSTDDVDGSVEEATDNGLGNGVALQGPLPEVARKLANAVSGVVRALECPICLESAASPVSQCVHGHILCVSCRSRTDRCPVCRVRLGQGRCLLADKVHGTLRESFALGDAEIRLGEKLFGKSNRVSGGSRDARNAHQRGTGASLGTRHLLARFWLSVGGGGGGGGGGSVDRLPDNRAASAENLSVIVGADDRKGEIGVSPRLAAKRLGELTSADRAKSASTGELASATAVRTLKNQPQDFPSCSNPDVTNERVTRRSGSFLGVPQTPTWGGSTESISNTFVRCPLAQSNACTELLTPGFLLEHLGTAHRGPQVHFYAGTATVSIPTPLGPNAIYVLHHGGEIFFFKCDEEAAWIVTAVGGARHWDWFLRGWGTDGTEVKLRRSVATLEEHFHPLTAQQIAPLPKALDIRTVEIQLTESRSEEVARM